MRGLRIAIVLFSLTLSLLGQKEVCIIGKIYDASSNEPLIGAVIIPHSNKNNALVSDDLGRFKYCKIDSPVNLSIRYLGYQEKTVSFSTSRDTMLTIYLVPAPVKTAEAVIRSQNNSDDISNPVSGLISLKREEFLNMPKFLGDADIIKSLQLTPGIQAANEGDGGIYVRGGSNGQNLVLFDGIPIYNPNHLFGFYSVFTPASISNVELFKGSVPAKYGGRVSSVINIEQYNPSESGIHSDINLGLISSNAVARYSTNSSDFRVMLSGRTTYLDYLQNVFIKYDLSNSGDFFKNTRYNFYDLNGQIYYRPSDKNIITVSGYYGDDMYNFNNPDYDLENNLYWGNSLLGIKYTYLINQDSYLAQQIGFSQYDFMMDSRIEVADMALNSSISDYFYRINYDRSDTTHSFNTGIDYIYHDVAPNNAKFTSDDILIEGNIRYLSHEIGIFTNYTYQVTRNIRVLAGVRFSGYIQTGPYYEANKETSDTNFYDQNEVVSWYVSPEPRLALNYQLTSSSAIDFSYTRLSQFIHQVPLGSVSLPTDLWIISTKQIKPGYSDNFSLGYKKELSNRAYLINVEGYYRKLANQIELFGGIFSDYNEKKVENSLVFGSGKAYGIEVSGIKEQGKITGRISYSLTKSIRSFPDINNGMPFPAKYDRTHDLSVAVNYTVNSKWSFSTVFVYATGNALNLPTQRYIIQNSVYNYYDYTNAFRMPAYHRLDISITRNINTRRFKSALNLSVYNVYNRNNPYFIFFDAEGDLDKLFLSVELREVSLFPILPSLSWNFTF